MRNRRMTTARIARILGLSAMLAVTLIAVAIGATYGISEWKLQRRYEALLEPLRAKTAPDLVEGERMARSVGCWDGCHGRRAEGGYGQIKGILKHTAPTLSQVVPLYSDEELVRLIRYGLKRDGRSAVGITSYTFWALGDQDLSNIIAHGHAGGTCPRRRPWSVDAILPVLPARNVTAWTTAAMCWSARRP